MPFTCVCPQNDFEKRAVRGAANDPSPLPHTNWLHGVKSMALNPYLLGGGVHAFAWARSLGPHSTRPPKPYPKSTGKKDSTQTSLRGGSSGPKWGWMGFRRRVGGFSKTHTPKGHTGGGVPNKNDGRKVTETTQLPIIPLLQGRGEKKKKK